MDVFRGNVPKVYAIHLTADFQVLSHARLSGNEVQFQQGILPFELGDLLLHFKQPRPPGNAIRLEGGRHRQADGFVRAGVIGHHQTGLQRVQSPFHALYRCVEGLQVDGYVGPRIHSYKCSESFRNFMLRLVRQGSSLAGKRSGGGTSSGTSAIPANKNHVFPQKMITFV